MPDFFSGVLSFAYEAVSSANDRIRVFSLWHIGPGFSFL